MTSCETWSQVELCRFCGLDLPAGSVEVMHHYNSHWRNFNGEPHSQSSCVFDQNPDLHIKQQNVNSEDLEVSGHFDQNFQYSYSPQTEPSNLSLAGTRCSPLNLTGRAKVDSPLGSPMPDRQNLDSNHLPVNNYPHQISNEDLNNYAVQQSYSTFENISISNCAVQEMPNFENNVNLSSLPSCELNGIQNSCKFDKKHKTCAKFESKCQLPVKNVCNKISNLSCSEHIKSLNSDATMSSQFILDIKPNDITQSIPYSLPYTVPIKPYKCSICNQEFTQKEELSEHFSTHEAAKPYRCNLCGTGLSHVSALKRHTLSHNGLKPHSCDVCSRSFFQRCDLQRHMSVHNKKTLQCSNCQRKFTYDYLLKNHKCRPPEEPRPFKCNICGEGCTTSVAWSYHMWKHTKNPAFVPCRKVSEAKLNQTSSDMSGR